MPISRLYRHTLILLLFAGTALPLSAQPAGPQLTFSLGPITHSSLLNDTRHVLAPELQVSHRLMHVPQAGLSVRGAVYSSYWHDGGEQSLTCADCVFHSYTTYIVGTRLGIVADSAFPVPVYLFGGTSYHALYAEYIGGAGIDGRPGADWRDPFWAVEAGGGLAIPVQPGWHIHGTLHAYVRVSESERRSSQRQFAFKIGVSYSLR